MLSEKYFLTWKCMIISSRLSLVSSRSQGDFLGKDDPGYGNDMSNPQQTSEPTSKRASFIEVLVFLLSV
jgi:hypothetical protein